MKKAGIFICASLALLASCSIGDTLESVGDLNIARAEAMDPLKAEPGDTVMFRFVASAGKGALERVEMASGDDIKGVPEKIELALTAGGNELTVDKDGYFSRPVSTVLVTYPVVIPNNPALRNTTVQMDIKITRDDGTVKILTQQICIINFINNFSGIVLNEPSKVLFYNPTEHVVYDATNYKANLEKIDMVVYVDASKVCFYMNPAADTTETIVRKAGLSDYSAVEMNQTQFVKGVTLDYIQIADKELDELVVVDGLDLVKMTANAVCGFKTADGRKGFAKFLSKSSSRTLVSKMQIKMN